MKSILGFAVTGLGLVLIGTAQVGAQTQQVCSSPGGIPVNDGAPAVDTLTVQGSGLAADLDVDLEITHTWVGDLQVTIQGPGCGPLLIVDRPGVPASSFGCSRDDINATLDDEGTSSVETACSVGVPAIAGDLVPSTPLSACDGMLAAGTWTLTVTDVEASDNGTLDEWCVNLVGTCGGSGPTVIIQCAPNVGANTCSFTPSPNPVTVNLGSGDSVTWVLDSTCASAPCPTLHPSGFTVSIPAQPGFPTSYRSSPLVIGGPDCTTSYPFTTAGPYTYSIFGSEFEGTIIVTEGEPVPALSHLGLALGISSMLLFLGVAVWRRRTRA